MLRMSVKLTRVTRVVLPNNLIVWDLVLAEWAESVSVNLAAEMPFYEIHDYGFVLELELQRVKMVF